MTLNYLPTWNLNVWIPTGGSWWKYFPAIIGQMCNPFDCYSQLLPVSSDQAMDLPHYFSIVLAWESPRGSLTQWKSAHTFESLCSMQTMLSMVDFLSYPLTYSSSARMNDCWKSWFNTRKMLISRLGLETCCILERYNVMSMLSEEMTKLFVHWEKSMGQPCPPMLRS